MFYHELNRRRTFTFELRKDGSIETIPIVDYSTSKFDMTKAKLAHIDGAITLTISMSNRSTNGAYLPIKFGPNTAFECDLSVMNEDKKSGTFQW